MLDAPGENGVRSEECIGGVHTSLFDLEQQQLLLQSSTGNAELIDLSNTEQSPLNLFLADDLSYVDLLYDLTGPQFDPLGRLSGDRELIFSIGGEEALATIEAGGSIRFNNPANINLFEVEDFLTIKFYQANDTANILWEYAFGGIEITSSSDKGSNKVQSFIICDAVARQRNICTAQLPITARLLLPVQETDSVQWRVEALEGSDKKDDMPGESKGGSGPGNKPFAYGKTKNWRTGGLSASAIAPTEFGNGRYQNAWVSQPQFGTEAVYFSFVPDMSDEPHTPKNYTSGKDAATSLNGTKKTDVWRHNPLVGYKISVIINGEHTITKTVKMDGIDIVRQEYINHLVSTQGTSSSLIVEVPERKELVNKNDLGSILAGDWSQSDYTYLVNKHLTMLANIASNNISSESAQTLNVLSNIGVSLPDGNTISGVMQINSGWRNPERNERVGGVVTSRHMVGRALDIGAEGVLGYSSTSENRSKMMWVMWNALQNAPATQGNVYIRYLMENGTTGLIQTGSSSASGNKPSSVTMIDNNGPGGAGGPDGIPDVFNEATHFHVETKPNLSVGD